ncbi:MAG TPA: thiazole synthase [bacterium]|nr:thiazole synthase [bacterium]
MNDKNKLKIGDRKFTNRLFTGTGKFSSKELIPKMLKASQSEMITVALRRVDESSQTENILQYIPDDVQLLPNTSGARTAKEAVRIAKIAREAGCGNFVKIEVINDQKWLMPDNEETLKATKRLAEDGFTVLPYVSPDLVLAKKLEKAGAAAVMPLGSPIGSHQGIQTEKMIEMLIEVCHVPVIVDAGIGRPSHAAQAMEMGADAVLVNTAISAAANPPRIARAFKQAVEAGRTAYLEKMGEKQKYASASSPLTGFITNN